MPDPPLTSRSTLGRNIFQVHSWRESPPRDATIALDTARHPCHTIIAPQTSRHLHALCDAACTCTCLVPLVHCMWRNPRYLITFYCVTQTANPGYVRARMCVGELTWFWLTYMYNTCTYTSYYGSIKGYSSTLHKTDRYIISAVPQPLVLCLLLADGLNTPWTV